VQPPQDEIHLSPFRSVNPSTRTEAPKSSMCSPPVPPCAPLPMMRTSISWVIASQDFPPTVEQLSDQVCNYVKTRVSMRTFARTTRQLYTDRPSGQLCVPAPTTSTCCSKYSARGSPREGNQSLAGDVGSSSRRRRSAQTEVDPGISASRGPISRALSRSGLQETR
jgi:hypothetical protein